MSICLFIVCRPLVWWGGSCLRCWMMLFRACVAPLPSSSFPLHQGTHISWPKSSVTVAVQCLLPAVYNLQLRPPPAPPTFPHTASAVSYVGAALIKHQWAVVWQKGVTSNKSLKPADDNVLTNAQSLIRQVYDPSWTHASAHEHEKKLSIEPCTCKLCKYKKWEQSRGGSTLRIKSCFVNVMQAGTHFLLLWINGYRQAVHLPFAHTNTPPRNVSHVVHKRC